MGLLDWLKGVLTPNKIPEDVDVEPAPHAHARRSEVMAETPRSASDRAEPARAVVSSSFLVTGRFDVEVVGEAHYQAALRRICARKGVEQRLILEAELRRDRGNEYDRNAVAVFVNQAQVGHLGREDARRYRRWIEELSAGRSRVTCPAELAAYWPGYERYEAPFSVKLDLPRPPKEAFEYWSSRVKYLKQTDALQRAVEEGLREVADEAHRGRLAAIAAKRSVDCTLEKIAKLKNSKTKLKNLAACREFVVSLRAHGLDSKEFDARLEKARRELASD